MSLILGKGYSPASLGYYTQARKLEQVPTEALGSIVSQVSFPVFSALQDDKEKLLYGVRKNIKSLMFLNAPLMLLFIVIGEPIFTLLYGTKWLTSVPYFRILCLGGMVYTLNLLNVNVIKSLGKGKIYFFVQFTKRLLSMLMIVGSIFIGKAKIMDGVLALVWAFTLSFYLNIVINAFVNKRLINYGMISQIKDIFVYILLAGIVAIVTWIMSGLMHSLNQYLVMVIQIILYVILYLTASALLKLEGFVTYKEIIFERIIKRKKK